MTEVVQTVVRKGAHVEVDEEDAGVRIAQLNERRGNRAAHLALAPAWWPVAFGHEISSTPVRATIAGTGLCLYRDGGGSVRAVIDACPHRRLPLSMGRVTADGDIQCGYHGWCFDGATGRCTAIPNLNADERVSPSIKVAVFPTVERVTGPADALTMFDTALADGFVHVWSGDGADRPVAPPADGATGQPALFGTLEARVPLALAADVLAASPGSALGLGLLLGAGEEVVRPDVDDEGKGVRIRRERRLIELPRASTFEPRGRHTVRVTTTVSPVTGMTTIDAERDDGRQRTRIVVGLTPINDYRTIVRWHGQVEGGRLATAAAALARRRPPARRFERLADELETSRTDPGVQRLRAMRSGA